MISKSVFLKYALIPGLLIFIVELLLNTVLIDAYQTRLPGGIMLGNGPIVLTVVLIPFLSAHVLSKTVELDKVALTSALLGLSYRIPSLIVDEYGGRLELASPQINWLTDLALTALIFAFIGACGFWVHKRLGL